MKRLNLKMTRKSDCIRILHPICALKIFGNVVERCLKRLRIAREVNLHYMKVTNELVVSLCFWIISQFTPMLWFMKALKSMGRLLLVAM